MNEESAAKSRVNIQLKRSNGILTEQDLKDAYQFLMDYIHIKIPQLITVFGI